MDLWASCCLGLDLKLNELVNLDRWIIDGDYSRTYEKRIVACDTLFFFDLGETLCMDGITERVGKCRSDIPWTESIFYLKHV